MSSISVSLSVSAVLPYVTVDFVELYLIPADFCDNQADTGMALITIYPVISK